ncbi:MAG TPA: ABC transporter permease [Chloroflexota bacterium]|nr:ABC transporter permease [Chloroflexota bacterium]
MLAYIVRRILYMIPVLFGVLLVVFVLMRMVPGDPIKIFFDSGDIGGAGTTGSEGGEVSRRALQMLRESYNLDKSIPHQFILYVWDLVRGDLGNSIQYRRPVTHILGDHWGATFQLTMASMAVAIVVGVGAGTLSAICRHTWVDHGAQIFAILGVSFPSFWVGLILVWIFAIVLGWLPAISNGFGKQLILPSFTLGLAAAAILARLTRSSMLDVLSRDYIRTARSKGMSERIVVWGHALRNALIPVVTVIGLEFGGLLAGAVVIEAVFFRQGLGLRLIEAITARDYPLIQALVLLAAAIYTIVNLLVDILYTYLDPRIRVTDESAE